VWNRRLRSRCAYPRSEHSRSPLPAPSARRDHGEFGVGVGVGAGAAQKPAGVGGVEQTAASWLTMESGRPQLASAGKQLAIGAPVAAYAVGVQLDADDGRVNWYPRHPSAGQSESESPPESDVEPPTRVTHFEQRSPSWVSRPGSVKPVASSHWVPSAESWQASHGRHLSSSAALEGEQIAQDRAVEGDLENVALLGDEGVQRLQEIHVGDVLDH
jgi:hypothetical protein